MKREKKVFGIILLAELILLIILICPCFRGRESIDLSSDSFHIDTDGSDITVSSDEIELEKGIYQLSFDYYYNTGLSEDYTVTMIPSEREGITNPNTTYVRGLEAEDFSLRNSHNVITNRVYVRENSCKFRIVIDGSLKEDAVESVDGYNTEKLFNVNEVIISYYRLCNIGTRAFNLLLLFIVIDTIYWLYIFKWWKNRTDSQKIIILTLGALWIVTNIPLYVDTLPIGHDLGFHLLRIKSIAVGLTDRVFPVRIQQLWMNNAGYATGVCYGDIFLYFPAILYVIGYPLRVAYKVYVFVINLLTIVISFFAAKKVSGSDRIALFSSIVYSMSIYRFVDLYTRASVGEYTALTFLPLILLGFYLWIQGDKSAKYYFIAGFTAVIESHVLSGIMMAQLCVILSLFWIKKVFQKDRLIEVAKAAIGTLLINAGFIIPFIDYYLHEDLCIKYANYSIGGEGLYLVQFFLTRFQTTAPSYNYSYGIANDVPASCGWAILIIIGFGIGSVLIHKASKSKVVLILLTLLFALLCTNYMPYDYLETNMPRLYNALFSSLQFPWRYLTIVVLVGSALFVVLQISEKSRCHSKYYYVSIMIVTVALLQGVVFLSDYSMQSDQDKFVDSSNIDSFYMVGEYIPSGTAISPIRNHNVVNYNIDEVRIAMEEQNKNTFYFYAENLSNHDATVEAPVIAYKGYKAFNEQGSELDSRVGEGHLLEITIPEGFKGQVKVVFSEPFYWRIAEIISVVAIICFWFILKRNYHGIRMT